jgi:hypothetical protein
MSPEARAMRAHAHDIIMWSASKSSTGSCCRSVNCSSAPEKTELFELMSHTNGDNLKRQVLRLGTDTNRVRKLNDSRFFSLTPSAFLRLIAPSLFDQRVQRLHHTRRSPQGCAARSPQRYLLDALGVVSLHDRLDPLDCAFTRVLRVEQQAVNLATAAT